MEDNNIDNINFNEKKAMEMMNIDYMYPQATTNLKLEDKHLLYKLYKKRELYYHKDKTVFDFKDVEDLQKYRKSVCTGSFRLQEQQALLSNYINPDTQYKGLLLFHGTGSGKCIMGDSSIVINNKLMTIKNIWDNFKTNLIPDDDVTIYADWSIPSEDLYVNSIHNPNNSNTYSSKSVMKIDKVKRLYRQSINEVVRTIKLSNGLSITTTMKHQFLTTKGWTNVIFPGDSIIIPNNVVKVKSIETFIYDGFVYDLETKKYHNYIANGIFCHNTCAAINIAEKFKVQVQKYNTKINILVPGPLLREQWKGELIKCTGNTYSNEANLVNTSKTKKIANIAISHALQYYKFTTYASFYKKVLGDKIKVSETKFERDVIVNKLSSMDNTLLIVEEAHNLTDNIWGEALKKIISNSKNLKVILLTATPMKNLADDIIELINYIRPINMPIERNKIFSKDKNHDMVVINGGQEYFKSMVRGYVSYFKGSNPILYATRDDRGMIPKGLKFTKVILCKMNEFQQKIYDDHDMSIDKDRLDRKSSAICNFVFPILTEDMNDLSGTHGNDGLNKVIEQLRFNQDKLNKLIGNKILKTTDYDDIIKISDSGKYISGKILKLENLKYFSTKYFEVITRLNKLVYGKKGVKTAFVYSNLVRVGIELFKEILLVNGYLEFNKTKSYEINDNTICYFCGHTHKDHKNKLKDIPEHDFEPATFITITGTSSEENTDYEQDQKQKELINIFNNIENISGKNIKLVLGSRVMNEGISLSNILNVHILDVYYNFGRIDQVVGRAVRWCRHYNIMQTDTYPSVKIYKYVVHMDDKISSEIDLYSKAEKKHLIVKQIERYMKEVAIDCPLNMNSNIHKHDLEKYKDCQKNNSCPAVCDYMDCNFKCDDKILNENFYDEKNNNYRDLTINEIDTSTYTNILTRNEIETIKKHIKNMFIFNSIYSIDEINNYIKNIYAKTKKELYDVQYIYNALDELLPVTQNDLNNFNDFIVDKYGTIGCIIYVKNYYLFQPLDKYKNITVEERKMFNKTIPRGMTLHNYLTSTDSIISEIVETKSDKDVFTDVMDYYNNRDEFKYIGILDMVKGNYMFKIRNKREKILDKKRATNIPSFKGADCMTKDKQYTSKILKEFNIKHDETTPRTELCSLLQNKLLFLEKYGSSEKGAKFKKYTYLMIPNNHPSYVFPYNLEDRHDYIAKIVKEFDDKIKISKKITNVNNLPEYYVTIDSNDKELCKLLKKFNPKLSKNITLHLN